jgi:membrane protein implicated in regulation of membrane protease activity
MLVAPVGVAVVIGILLRPLGAPVFFLAFASFLAAQLAVGVRSVRRLDDAKRRLVASRARRERLRGQRRG